MQTYAPIALFTYNRADHTRQAVESLLRNAEAKETDLFIFSDGPKNEKAAEGVKANREFIRTITGFKSITIIEREKNWGLANSLIAGITDVINKYGRIIVVEDDLTLSPFFLRFMNEALEKYKDDDRVSSISAYVYPSENEYPINFFLHYFLCWGWATWKDEWKLLNTDTRFLLRKMRFKKTKFDVGGNAGAYGNLYCSKIGLVDSWWVKLYATWFLAGKLTLYPGKTLVSNGGDDGSGTHSKTYRSHSSLEIPLFSNYIPVVDIEINESSSAYENFKAYFDNKVIRKSYYGKFKSFVRRLLYIDSL